MNGGVSGPRQVTRENLESKTCPYVDDLCAADPSVAGLSLLAQSSLLLRGTPQPEISPGCDRRFESGMVQLRSMV